MEDGSGVEHHGTHDLVRVAGVPEARGERWRQGPHVGPATQELVGALGLSDDSRDIVLAEAIDVLSQCVPVTAESGTRTGIVVGYIQSGKTMSFTVVSALAHDNGYGMVVVITGTATNLFRQSTDRLLEDLRIRGPARRWQQLANPTPRNAADRRTLQNALRAWRTPNPRRGRQSILVTVMKHFTHLDNLADLLSELELDGVPVLVIDDEADQAGLNTEARRGDASATYRRLLRVRSQLPHHTYLQYTATPQAPLLINLIDALSPDFATVLTPGELYTGGRTFFEEGLPLVRVIPEDDVPTPDGGPTEPPESLQEAMRLFIVGVTAGLAAGPPPDNRSMMLHPSQRVAWHDEYCRWVEAILRRWQAECQLPDHDPDRQELVDALRRAHDDLAATVDDLLSFEEVLAWLPDAILETIPNVVNAAHGPTPSVDWDRVYSPVVIGGQALERGVTIEGLTVTYMPRPRGVGNADTIQQRARWFGYKGDYVGYCRVYLSRDTRDAYESYVTHEESVRVLLREHALAGRPLNDWRRAFFLDAGLQPTRANVLSLDYMRGNYADDWWNQTVPHFSPDALEANRDIIAQFVAAHNWGPWSTSAGLRDTHRHAVTGALSLREVYDRLLLPARIAHPGDSCRFTGLLLQLQSHLEQNPDIGCSVYLMRPDVREPTYRQVTQDGVIRQLFQGAYPVRGPRVYPGDRHVRADEGVTVQVHRIHELRSQGGEVVARDVPVLAVWVPRELAAWWVSQPQGGTAPC